MARGRKYEHEVMFYAVRQIEASVAGGKTIPEACDEKGIAQRTYVRWRDEYGTMQMDQLNRMLTLEEENTRLKRLVVQLSLDKLVLKDLYKSQL